MEKIWNLLRGGMEDISPGRSEPTPLSCGVIVELNITHYEGGELSDRERACCYHA